MGVRSLIGYEVYATGENGDGHVQSLGEYEDLEEINIRVGMFAKEVVITICARYGEKE